MMKIAENPAHSKHTDNRATYARIVANTMANEMNPVTKNSSTWAMYEETIREYY